MVELWKLRINKTMKKILFLFLIFAYSAKAQTLTWAKQMGNPTNTTSNQIASDALGNIYVLGNFQTTTDFDPGAGVQNLSSFSNSVDVFLAKYDNAGNFVWVRQMGGNFNEGFTNLLVDPAGNAYCYGSFLGIGTFGSTVLDVALGEVFLTKINPSGVFEWAGQLKCHFPRTIDLIGNDILISGHSYATTTDFDMGAGVSNQTFTGYVGQYIARYTTAGVLVWAKIFTGPVATEAQNAVNSVYVDGSENIYSVNKFKGAIDFDPNAGTNILTGVGPELETGLFKLNSTGVLQWAKQFAGSTPIIASTIAPDPAGNLQVSGTLVGTADMDPGIGISNLTAVNNGALYLSKFDLSGNFISTRKIDGPASASDYLFQFNSFFKTNGKNVIEVLTSGKYDFGDGVVEYFNQKVIACYDPSNNLLWKEVMPTYTSGIFSENGSNMLTVGSLTAINFDVDPEGGPTHILNMNNVAGGLFFRKSNIEPPVIPTAANMTWNGSLSTTWNVPDNWTPYGVPTAITNVTIPTALTNYPKMTGDSTVNGINMTAGSSIDFNGKKLTVNRLTPFFNSIVGATLNNTATGTDIVLDINTGIGGYNNTFNSNTINDNITINLSGFDSFNEGTTNTKNIYNGNTTFNINGLTPFVYSHNVKSDNNGDLVINRTVAGSTVLFNNGGKVTGNFSFSNPTSGTSTIGNNAIKTLINGKVDINVNNNVTSNFGLYYLVNQTAGGVISVQNSLGFEVKSDTLLVNSLSITGYRGTNFASFYDNKISGDLTIADDASYTGGYHTTIYRNEIGGNTVFTDNGTNTLFDANGANTQNNYHGNISYISNSSGTLDIGNGSKSNYDGNVIVSRTSAGTTTMFNQGATIGGNFTFTNPTAGSTTLGNIASKTSIGGTLNIAVTNNTITSPFGLYRFVNQTGGGSVSVQNSLGFEVKSDTLLVNSVSITGYRGNSFASFHNNKISGDVTIADDISYTAGYHTTIYRNEIGGNAVFTDNGTNTLFDASGANTQNNYHGNVSYISNSTGALEIGNGSKSNYDGNVIVTRNGIGNTTMFNQGAAILGNFSFTNPTSGGTTLGNIANKTSIGGTLNIAVTNNTITSPFGLYRFVNQTGGGSVSVQNSFGFEIKSDTLLVNSLSITGYRGNSFASFYDNKISGDVIIADDASYTGGYHTTIYRNEIGGNTVFTDNGTNTLFDANGSGTGNKYLGNVTYIKNGGSIEISTGSQNEYGKGIILNSASGINIGSIKLNTAANGIIEQLGTQPLIIPNIKLEKIGTAKLTLNSQLTVGNTIAFTSGYISASTSKELVFPDNIGYTGGSDASYVEGQVIKRGNDAFSFPVGGGGKLAKIGISAPTNVTDEFKAAYLDIAPGNPTQKEASIDHISLNETWILIRSVGTSNVLVTLSWETARSGIIDALADLRVVGYETSTIWVDKGNGGTTGTSLSGEIVSAAAVNSFTTFTLASANASNSLLPIFESINTGLWHVGSTWITPSNPVVPTAKKIAKINATHTVSISNSGNNVKTVQLNGGVINLNGGTLEIKNQ
jgi:hypothetical protein